jgi:putative PEP-CTERM system histidine kinase
MTLFITYGLGCLSFLALLGLMMARPARRLDFRFIGLAAVMALWSGVEAFVPVVPAGFVHLLGSVALWGWLQYLAAILDAGTSPRRPVLGLRVAVLGLANFANDLRFLLADGIADYDFSQCAVRIALSVVGLLLVENLVRNTPGTRRWQITPLALAAGLYFAYDIYVFAEALVMRRLDSSLLAGGGLVLVMMVPALIVAQIRNEDRPIDVNISRKLVFHTATLTAGGVLLLLAAGVSGFIGHIPGEWGPILKVGFLSGCVFLLACALSVEGWRSRFRSLVTEHFFASRFDYRAEWLRFLNMISATDGHEPLQVRTIRALANVVDSPAGVLWLEARPGSFEPAAFLNMRLGEGACESLASDFFRKFEGGSHVQKFDPLDKAAQPGWVLTQPIWLAVPLMKGESIEGFVTLASPRAPLTLNWESYALLRIIARQVASYLSEERAAKALSEAEAIIDYNKRFAFVVHDIKNLANQLGLMVSNAKRLGDHPEFRDDMMKSLERSVQRLGEMLNRLKSHQDPVSRAPVIDPVPVMRRVAEDAGRGEIAVDVIAGPGTTRVRIDAEALRSALAHLVSNAIEASPAGNSVALVLQIDDKNVVLEVRDQGAGMSPDFVRNRLFRPLQSTKERGHGIGAFQAREIARAAGGDIEVVSEEGKGTTMRIILPSVKVPVLAAAGA